MPFVEVCVVCRTPYMRRGRCQGWPVCPRLDIRQRDWPFGRRVLLRRIRYILLAVWWQVLLRFPPHLWLPLTEALLVSVGRRPR